MNKNWKKLLGIGVASLLVLAACGDSGDGGGGEGAADITEDEDVELETYDSGDQTLVVWSFTDEISTMVEDYYTPENPDLDYQIDIVNIPTLYK